MSTNTNTTIRDTNRYVPGGYICTVCRHFTNSPDPVAQWRQMCPRCFELDIGEYVVTSNRAHGTEWLSVVGDQYSPGVWAASPEAAVRFPNLRAAKRAAAIKGGVVRVARTEP